MLTGQTKIQGSSGKKPMVNTSVVVVQLQTCRQIRKDDRRRHDLSQFLPLLALMRRERRVNGAAATDQMFTSWTPYSDAGPGRDLFSPIRTELPLKYTALSDDLQ